MHLKDSKYAPELIALHDISISWDGRQVLKDVNLTVHRGDFLAITGPNGGGKTTLLRILLGLLKPTSGIVRRDEHNLRIGYLPQKNMIDAHFPITVREVVMSGLLAVKHMDKAAQQAAYTRTIDRIGLHEHVDRPIGLLSGGQLQRALLGRAIIADPQLLILDEPLSYIDKAFEERLYGLIAELARTTTIVLVSHEMTRIAAMANRHLIVDHTLHECHSTVHYNPTTCC